MSLKKVYITNESEQHRHPSTPVNNSFRLNKGRSCGGGEPDPVFRVGVSAGCIKKIHSHFNYRKTAFSKMTFQWFYNLFLR